MTKFLKNNIIYLWMILCAYILIKSSPVEIEVVSDAWNVICNDLQCYFDMGDGFSEEDSIIASKRKVSNNDFLVTVDCQSGRQISQARINFRLNDKETYDELPPLHLEKIVYKKAGIPFFTVTDFGTESVYAIDMISGEDGWEIVGQYPGILLSAEAINCLYGAEATGYMLWTIVAFVVVVWAFIWQIWLGHILLPQERRIKLKAELFNPKQMYSPYLLLPFYFISVFLLAKAGLGGFILLELTFLLTICLAEYLEEKNKTNIFFLAINYCCAWLFAVLQIGLKILPYMVAIACIAVMVIRKIPGRAVDFSHSVRKMRPYVLAVILGLLGLINIDATNERFYASVTLIDQLMVIGFFYLLVMCRDKLEPDDKRTKLCSWITGGVLAGLWVFGYNINLYNDLYGLTNNIGMRLLLKWTAYAYGFSTIWLWVYYKRKSIRNVKDNKKWSLAQHKQAPIALYLLCLLGLLAAWLPVIWDNLPGILLGDSYNQIYMAIGQEKLSTHHPLAMTLLIKLCMILGRTYEEGILLYTMISVSAILLIFARIIYYMLVKRWNQILVGCTALFFAFFPVFSYWSVTVGKDMIFAAFVGWYVLKAYDIVKYRKMDILSGVELMAAAVGVALTRKNGMYLLMFTAIFSLFLKINRAIKYRFASICFIVVVANMCVEGPIAQYFGITKGSAAEMLSLPIQQMARIEKNVKDLDDDLERQIDAFFMDNADLKKEYVPIISDNTKRLLDRNYFQQHKVDFIKLAVALFCKYPDESLEAWMCNSYGYWYPTPINWFYIYGRPEDTKYIYEHQYPTGAAYEYYNDYKFLPIISLFTSIGLLMWIYIVMLSFCICDKEYQKIIVFMPLFALWLTCVASPVWNELRYILGVYVSLPIVIGVLNDKGVTDKSEKTF